MLTNLMFLLILLAALGTGVMGGLFFAFSTSVMNALARLLAAQGVAAMQSINVVIPNPVFFVAFFGTAALCVVLTIAALLRWGEPGAAWLLAGNILYLAGIIVVTMVFNVPLNNALAAVDPASAEGDPLDSLSFGMGAVEPRPNAGRSGGARVLHLRDALVVKTRRLVPDVKDCSEADLTAPNLWHTIAKGTRGAAP